jgi:hypothetical protein
MNGAQSIMMQEHIFMFYYATTLQYLHTVLMGYNPQDLDDEEIAYNEVVSNLQEPKQIRLKLQTQCTTSISPVLSTNIILAFQE